jgi:Ca2+-binding EF-hand superfamily protein
MNYLSGMIAIPMVGASLFAAAPSHAQTQTMSRDTFLVMDIDGSGQVDAVEFGMAMGAAFAHADDNADGTLDAQEVTVLALPAQVDTDGNGQVTINEYLVSVRNDFRRADGDEDSILLP